MSEEKTPQFNIRFNLSNPYHKKLFEHLKEFPTDVYKTKNEYVAAKLYEGVFGNLENLPEQKMREMEERIVQRVTSELLKTILSGNVQLTSLRFAKEETELTEDAQDKIDEEVTSAALGYFDDWSDEDDEY